MRFDHSLRLTKVLLALNVLSFVVLLFASGQSDFHFHQGFFKIHPGGDDSEPTGLHGVRPLKDLPFIHQQPARAGGLVVGEVAEHVLGDVRVVEHRSFGLKPHEGVIDLRGTIAQGLDLGPRQYDAALQRVFEKIVALGAAVAGLLVTRFIRFLGHRWRQKTPE